MRGAVDELDERRDGVRCMDLAEKVGWPREPSKWSLLFALGRAWGVREGDALTAMVVMPELDGATCVAMMVVDPRAQGRGLGRRVLEIAMAASRPPFVLYATPRGRPLYERLGFCTVDEVGKHVGVTVSAPAPAPRPSRGVREATAAGRARIVEIDRRASGFGRGALLERILASAERAVVDDDGGFAIRWFNGHASVVGPVAASSEDGAIALVDAALEGAPASRPARVDVLAGSPRLAVYVAARGLVEVDRAPKMTWPEALTAAPERAGYRAIALQAFG